MLNLILFHRLLIVCAIAFCAMFSVYEIINDRLLLGIVFAVLTVALAWYLRHLARVLKLPQNRKP